MSLLCHAHDSSVLISGSKKSIIFALNIFLTCFRDDCMETSRCVLKVILEFFLNAKLDQENIYEAGIFVSR